MAAYNEQLFFSNYLVGYFLISENIFYYQSRNDMLLQIYCLKYMHALEIKMHNKHTWSTTY